MNIEKEDKKSSRFQAAKRRGERVVVKTRERALLVR